MRRLRTLKAKRGDDGSHRRLLAVIAVLAVIAAAAFGLVFVCRLLRGIWQEPAALTDVSAQVTVAAGKMVKDDAVREAFGLRKGVNLARVDFASRRREVLEKYPTIRAIEIVRRVPDRVHIAVSEREPVARMGVSGQRRETGRVADVEGVVFPCRRGTAMLPLIREVAETSTAPGKRLRGNARAALCLVERAKDPDFADIGVLEIDTSHPDYLVVTLGNGDRAKVAWTGMGDPEDDHLRELSVQLSRFAGALRTAPTGIAKLWDATIPGQFSYEPIGGK